MRYLLTSGCYGTDSKIFQPASSSWVLAVRALTARPEVPYYRNAMSLARVLNFRISGGVKRFGAVWQVSGLFLLKDF